MKRKFGFQKREEWLAAERAEAEERLAKTYRDAAGWWAERAKKRAEEEKAKEKALKKWAA